MPLLSAVWAGRCSDAFTFSGLIFRRAGIRGFYREASLAVSWRSQDAQTDGNRRTIKHSRKHQPTPPVHPSA
jgi:hypothetical protein